MRRTFLAAAAFALLACGQEAPTESRTESSVLVSLEGSILGITGAAGGALGMVGNIPELPAHLALSEEQRTLIAALIDAYQTAMAADCAALADIERRAREARNAGRPRTEVDAIRAEGSAIRQRMETAAAQLRRDIFEVLTPAQRDALHARGGTDRPCDGSMRLTADQQAQISALITAFNESNAADRSIVESAFAAARAARAAGESDAAVRALLQPAHDALRRLEAAHAELQAQIRAVLTTEQIASGCFARR